MTNTLSAPLSLGVPLVLKKVTHELLILLVLIAPRCLSLPDGLLLPFVEDWLCKFDCFAVFCRSNLSSHSYMLVALDMEQERYWGFVQDLVCAVLHSVIIPVFVVNV